MYIILCKHIYRSSGQDCIFITKTYQPWRLDIFPSSGGICPERLFTLRYNSESSVKLPISLGTAPLSSLKCRYKPDKLLSNPISSGICPESPFPCREMLTTWPPELQAMPWKEPSAHGSVALGDQEERMRLFGSREDLMAMRREISVGWERENGGFVRKISVEMERRREKEFMFALMENGMESFLMFPFFCSVKSLSFLA